MTHPHGSNRHRPRDPRRAGFTLAEVLVVLVIIGIGAAMAVPRVNLTPHRTEAAVQDLASLMMAAQRAAVTGQHDVVVAFEVTARRVRVHQDRDNDGVMDAGEPVKLTDLPNLVVFGRTAPAMAQLGSGAVSFTRQQAGVPAVTFNRAGSASEEGGFYITTAAQTSPKDATTRAVLVDRATARAVTYRYRGSAWQRRF